MNCKKKSHSAYREIIAVIAELPPLESNKNYIIAKSFLRQLYPDWDDVKIETTILWDIRESHQPLSI